jgi:hypothetical protein
MGSFLSVLTAVGLLGFFLFLHVWLPVQAERGLMGLRKMEVRVSEKKAELQVLQEKYERLTSLSALDEWAKKNGPWRVPGANDIHAIKR